MAASPRKTSWSPTLAPDRRQAPDPIAAGPSPARATLMGERCIRVENGGANRFREGFGRAIHGQPMRTVPQQHIGRAFDVRSRAIRCAPHDRHHLALRIERHLSEKVIGRFEYFDRERCLRRRNQECTFRRIAQDFPRSFLLPQRRTVTQHGGSQ